MAHIKEEQNVDALVTTASNAETLENNPEKIDCSVSEKSGKMPRRGKVCKKDELQKMPSVYEFSQWKAFALGKADLSKKGSVDDAIYGLVCYINNQSDYFTTSSCSGRILVCSDDPLISELQKSDAKTNNKRDCTWYFVSHTTVNVSDVIGKLKSVAGPSKLKFEPFVLHVQCRTVESAKVLHQAAFRAGFRNSGITFGKGGKKIIAAVRGTACLEIPVTDTQGLLLTSDTYIDYIAKIANQKLENNFKMINAFEGNLISALSSTDQMQDAPSFEKPTGVYRKKKRTGKRERSQSNEVLEVDSSCLFG